MADEDNLWSRTARVEREATSSRANLELFEQLSLTQWRQLVDTFKGGKWTVLYLYLPEQK